MLPKVLIAASVKPIMLSILAHGEAYGYQIIQRIQKLSDGKMRWTAGTLYPVLHRLETKGLIVSTWRESESGRPRKYYQLTPEGQRELEVERRQWMDVHSILMKLWGPELSFA